MPRAQFGWSHTEEAKTRLGTIRDAPTGRDPAYDELRRQVNDPKLCWWRDERTDQERNDEAILWYKALEYAETNPLPEQRVDKAIRRAMIVDALERSNGIQKDAAKLLGMSPRALHHHIKANKIAMARRPARDAT